MLEKLSIVPKDDGVYWVILEDDLCKCGYHLLWICADYWTALAKWGEERREMMRLFESGHLVSQDQTFDRMDEIALECDALFRKGQ